MENVADTLNRALEMPLDERQLRMFQLKKREKRMDVDAWVQAFLHTMGAIFDDKVVYKVLCLDALTSILKYFVLMHWTLPWSTFVLMHWAWP